jgi:hypothetical protein
MKPRGVVTIPFTTYLAGALFSVPFSAARGDRAPVRRGTDRALRLPRGRASARRFHLLEL